MADLGKVYEAVDREKDRFVTDLQRVVRQPSVSARSYGVRECAELLRTMLQDLGADARVMETAWLPIVFGEIKTSIPGAPTLLIYNHYDVQPEDPVEEWKYPPFGAEIHDGVLYGRGATDAKGNLLAQLKALDAYKTAGVPLPCNIKFIFDGEEESGSPSLPAWVDENLELIRADGALSFDGGFDASDKPRIQLGSSGLLFVEIRAKGADGDLHSARARIVENPAWRLVWALNKLKGEDGRINLPGFYDRIRPVSDSDRAALAKVGWDDEKQYKDLGIRRFLGGVTGLKAFEQLLFTPTCNIAGFGTGYMGPGKKTVLPSRAAVRLDFRLVADMDPVEILGKLRTFLDANGCADFEIECKGSVEPSRTSIDNPFAAMVVDAAKRVYGVEPGLRPTGDASGRQGVWLGGKLGGVPAASSSVGPPAWNGHAPNEFMKIDYYLRGIKYAATIWSNFGEGFGRNGAR